MLLIYSKATLNPTLGRGLSGTFRAHLVGTPYSSPTMLTPSHLSLWDKPLECLTKLQGTCSLPTPFPGIPPLTQMLPNGWRAWMGPGGQTPSRGEASWPPASIPSAVIWQESTSCIYLHICLCLWLVIYSLPFMGSGARAHLNSSQVRLTKKEG